MTSHFVSPSTPMRPRLARRAMAARLATLALAVIFTSSQLSAQSISGPNTADEAGTTNSQASTVNQADASQGNQTAPAGQIAAIDLSAPTPNIDQAALAKPFSDSMFSLAAAQDTAQNSPPTPAANADVSKTKPPHHGLGAALAIAGTVILAAGVVLAAGADSNICSNEHQGGCQEARTGGYVAIGGGGAIAATGFYLLFRH